MCLVFLVNNIVLFGFWFVFAFHVLRCNQYDIFRGGLDFRLQRYNYSLYLNRRIWPNLEKIVASVQHFTIFFIIWTIFIISFYLYNCCFSALSVFRLQNYNFFFILSLSFSFTHSLFLRKVRSAAGAATPVYAENAVSEVFGFYEHFSIRTFPHGAQTAQTTVEERFPIKGYSALSSLSVLIRHYLLLSGIIRH